jgi:hypothetical protein
VADGLRRVDDERHRAQPLRDGDDRLPGAHFVVRRLKRGRADPAARGGRDERVGIDAGDRVDADRRGRAVQLRRVQHG